MSYVLDTKVKRELEKPGLADVERVTADVRQNHQGEDVLAFEVVIADDLAFASPAAKGVGKRLQAIQRSLRERAANAGVGLFASVRFVAASETPRRVTKTA